MATMMILKGGVLKHDNTKPLGRTTLATLREIYAAGDTEPQLKQTKWAAILYRFLPKPGRSNGR